MKGITVCVDYVGELQRSLPRFMQFCDDITVVTSPKDVLTIDYCLRMNASLHITNAFYEDGAAFNKGKALNEAIQTILKDDWICVFDADILPPDDFVLPELEVGMLYGAPRKQEGGGLIPEPKFGMPGYFWLFHPADPHLPHNPTFTSWAHAGNYDTVFKQHWPRQSMRLLPVIMTHIGEPGKNWWGRGNEAQMTGMYIERRKRGGSYAHESI